MSLAPLPHRGHIRPRSLAWPALALVLAAALLLAGNAAHGQPQPATPSMPGLAKAPGTKTPAKPEWSELTAAQQVALKPLLPAWGGMGVTHKRKWIALSRNYASLSVAEQATLHGRMSEWAALSPAQRSQARLNFAETKGLSPEEKMAHWEAYQALSPEQKKQLAATAQPKTVGGAPAVTPVSPSKLASVPTTRSDSGHPRAAASRPRAVRAGAPSPQPAVAVSAPMVAP